MAAGACESDLCRAEHAEPEHAPSIGRQRSAEVQERRAGRGAAGPARAQVYQSLGSAQPSASGVDESIPGGIPCAGASAAWGPCSYTSACALVHLVEHRAVDHRRSQPHRAAHPPPVEAAASWRSTSGRGSDSGWPRASVRCWPSQQPGNSTWHVVHAERAARPPDPATHTALALQLSAGRVVVKNGPTDPGTQERRACASARPPPWGRARRRAAPSASRIGTPPVVVTPPYFAPGLVERIRAGSNRGRTELSERPAKPSPQTARQRNAPRWCGQSKELLAHSLALELLPVRRATVSTSLESGRPVRSYVPPRTRGRLSSAAWRTLAQDAGRAHRSARLTQQGRPRARCRATPRPARPAASRASCGPHRCRVRVAQQIHRIAGGVEHGGRRIAQRAG